MLSLKKFLLNEEKETDLDPMVTPFAKTTDSYKPSHDEVVMEYFDSTFKNAENNKKYSLKYTFNGTELILRYATIVYMASEMDLQPQVVRYNHEAQQIFSDIIKSFKEYFKQRTGKSLKLVQKSENDNVELVQSTANSLRKVAYYRMNKTFVVGKGDE